MYLPTELLALVFNFCYLESRKNDEAPSLSTLFPYSLAEVDPLWKAILLKFPDYWTRLVYIPPSGVDGTEGISRPTSNKLVGVAIIRRCGANHDDAADSARSQKFMDLLESNMWQCKKFFIDVYASSSLPDITTDSNYIPPTFKYVRGVNDHAVSHERRVRSPSYIIAMVLEGCTLKRNISWLRHYTPLMSLSVIPPPFNNRNLNTVDVNWALKNVSHLMTPPKEGSANPPCITVEDIDNPRFFMTLTQSMYLSLLLQSPHSPQLQQLHLTCSGGGGVFLRDIPQCGKLILEGYNRTHFIISGLFEQTIFVSPELHLINCTGFTDSELDLLSKINSTTKCPLFAFNLRYLRLTRCRNFTIGALKGMVNARRWLGLWDFGSLDINGHGTTLEAVDGAWLYSRLIRFLWEGEVSCAVS